MVGGSWHCFGALPAGEGPGGEGPYSQKAQAAASQTPLPARPWSLRLPTPRKVCPSLGFHRKLGMEEGGPWT